MQENSRRIFTSITSKLYKNVKEALSRSAFSQPPEEQKKALRADKKLKTIPGRLVRELERNLKTKEIFEEFKNDRTVQKCSIAKTGFKKSTILFMSLKWSASARARNTRNMNLGTKYPS